MAAGYVLREPVEIEAVKATLPFIRTEMVKAMVQVHLLCTMRSQDVVNLHLCDLRIDPPGYPFGHTPRFHSLAQAGE
jgi:hypothetical protein